MEFRVEDEKIEDEDEATISVIRQFSQEVKTFWKERKNSCLSWTAFMLLNIANVLMVIWFVAPGWGWTLEIGGMDNLEGEYYGYYGIWWSCWDLVEGDHPQSCALNSETELSLPAYWEATQGLSVCVMIFGLAAFGLYCVYMFNKSMHGNTTLILVYIAVVFIAGALNIALFVVFCVEFIHHNRWVCCDPDDHRQVIDYSLWYAFGLACAGQAFYIASGIAAIFEYVDLKKEQRLRAMYEAMETRRRMHASFEETGSMASMDRFRPGAPYPYPYPSK